MAAPFSSAMVDFLGKTADTFDEQGFYDFVRRHPGFCRVKYGFGSFVASSSSSGLSSSSSRDLYPLSRLCCMRPSVALVRFVHHACPEAILFKDKYSCLALHFACAFGASVEVIRFLITMYPQAVMLRQRDDYLPLHFACRQEETLLPVVQVLCMTGHVKESLYAKNIKGQLPIDLITVTATSTSSTRQKRAFLDYLMMNMEGSPAGNAIDPPKSRQDILKRVSDCLLAMNRAKSSDDPQVVLQGWHAETQMNLLKPCLKFFPTYEEVEQQLAEVEEFLSAEKISMEQRLDGVLEKRELQARLAPLKKAPEEKTLDDIELNEE